MIPKRSVILNGAKQSEESLLSMSEAVPLLRGARGVFEANGKRNPAMVVPAFAFISSLRYEDTGSIRAKLKLFEYL